MCTPARDVGRACPTQSGRQKHRGPEQGGPAALTPHAVRQPAAPSEQESRRKRLLGAAPGVTPATPHPPPAPGLASTPLRDPGRLWGGARSRNHSWGFIQDAPGQRSSKVAHVEGWAPKGEVGGAPEPGPLGSLRRRAARAQGSEPGPPPARREGAPPHLAGPPPRRRRLPPPPPHPAPTLGTSLGRLAREGPQRGFVLQSGWNPGPLGLN